ncbi:MAG: DUF1328 domain-containing protein [Flavobacteriaceae bacterium]|nr:DUF1328 domain-containing protein [Flavobacteriaceae bacterium]
MLHWFATLIILAVVSAIIGFLGIGEGPVYMAQLIFYLLIILFILLVVRQQLKNRQH